VVCGINVSMAAEKIFHRCLLLYVIKYWLFHWYGSGIIIDIESLQNRFLKVCYVPATRAGLYGLLFFLYLFLLWPLTVPMKQTRQEVCTIKQSMLLRCLWVEYTAHNLKTHGSNPATGDTK
jgi:hypothetical protein